MTIFYILAVIILIACVGLVAILTSDMWGPKVHSWLMVRLEAVPVHECKRLVDAAHTSGFDRGTMQAKVHFRQLPMPFDPDTLAGGDYGTFITPIGFADRFGHCNIPAPGKHGYEQRAYYVGKNELLDPMTLHCKSPVMFDNPADSDTLVPVIVTVLR